MPTLIFSITPVCCAQESVLEESKQFFEEPGAQQTVGVRRIAGVRSSLV
jgi:hypothetical protein